MRELVAAPEHELHTHRQCARGLVLLTGYDRLRPGDGQLHGHRRLLIGEKLRERQEAAQCGFVVEYQGHIGLGFVIVVPLAAAHGHHARQLIEQRHQPANAPVDGNPRPKSLAERCDPVQGFKLSDQLRPTIGVLVRSCGPVQVLFAVGVLPDLPAAEPRPSWPHIRVLGGRADVLGVLLAHLRNPAPKIESLLLFRAPFPIGGSRSRPQIPVLTDGAHEHARWSLAEKLQELFMRRGRLLPHEPILSGALYRGLVGGLAAGRVVAGQLTYGISTVACRLHFGKIRSPGSGGMVMSWWAADKWADQTSSPHRHGGRCQEIKATDTIFFLAVEVRILLYLSPVLPIYR